MRLQGGRQDAAAGLVLEAREQLPREAEARRHDPGGVTRVHAFAEDVDGERAGDQPDATPAAQEAPAQSVEEEDVEEIIELFARALSVEPKVLLLDEPTRGVDVGAKFDIYSLIRVWSARGMAVLVASSDFPELIGMCDRIMAMRAGKIATVLEAAGLSEEELLGHCYGAGAPRDAPGTSGREARQ